MNKPVQKARRRSRQEVARNEAKAPRDPASNNNGIYRHDAGGFASIGKGHQHGG